MLSAIVLAAGLSGRMGTENKLLLAYMNSTVLATTLSNIVSAGIEDIIVVTGHESSAISKQTRQFPVRVVHNPLYKQGMTTSIQEGVKHASGKGYMICLADMLLIEPGEYRLLQQSFEACLSEDPKCICLPRYNHTKGNPVTFSSWYKPLILAHTEMEGCKAIIQQHQQQVSWIDMPSNHILTDMDYPEDYQKLLMQ